MNIITLEVIFDRFASRLKERQDDVQCIVYAESGYEKWAQWELYLSLSEYCYPVIYNQTMGVIRAEDKGRKGETIGDIKLEPKFKDGRADLFVATKPFIHNFVKYDTWECKDEFLPGDNENSDLITKYEDTSVHLIELKVEWWESNGPAKFEKDLAKISFENEKNETYYKEEYGAETLIAISLVTFYSSKDSANEKESEGFWKDKCFSKIKDFTEEYDKEHSGEPKFTWLYTHLFENSFLIGAYRKIRYENHNAQDQKSIT